MTIGFRDTEEDRNLIARLQREGESTTDVLRRALRALDRQAWEAQAFADMERLRDEDLSSEPDDWGGSATPSPAPAVTEAVPVAVNTSDFHTFVGPVGPAVIVSSEVGGHANAWAMRRPAEPTGNSEDLRKVYEELATRWSLDNSPIRAFVYFTHHTVPSEHAALAIRKADVEADYDGFFQAHAKGGSAE